MSLDARRYAETTTVLGQIRRAWSGKYDELTPHEARPCMKRLNVDERATYLLGLDDEMIAAMTAYVREVALNWSLISR